MNDVIFDIKHVRSCGTVRSNKNDAPVMPLKPMTFLVKRNPTAIPQRPDWFSKPARSEKSDLSTHYIQINFLSLHQRNLM